MKLHPSRKPEANGFLAAASLVVSVGSSLLAGSSARRSAAKQREELRRREEQGLRLAEQGATEVKAAGRAAAAPLRREAGMLEDSREFRDPLLEQSLLDSVRQEAGQAVDRTSVARNPGAARAGVVNQLFQSRGLMAKESARIARVTRLQSTRASLLQSAGQFDVQSASEAARVRMQGAGLANGLPMPDQGPNTAAAIGGGLTAAFDSMSDEQRQGIEDQLGKLFGGGESDTTTAFTRSQFNSGAAEGIDNIEILPDDALEKMLGGIKSTFGFGNSKPSADPAGLKRLLALYPEPDVISRMLGPDPAVLKRLLDN